MIGERMTNETAIHNLFALKLRTKVLSDRDALGMGIKALEREYQEPSKWIPVSERLPEEAYGCIVTVMDTNPMTLEEFENIYPDFVGWDGENWNDADGDSIPFEVIAWMPLPQPYKAESEEEE